mgnify:CR=1 FL=1
MLSILYNVTCFSNHILSDAIIKLRAFANLLVQKLEKLHLNLSNFSRLKLSIGLLLISFGKFLDLIYSLKVLNVLVDLVRATLKNWLDLLF